MSKNRKNHHRIHTKKLKMIRFQSLVISFLMLQLIPKAINLAILILIPSINKFLNQVIRIYYNPKPKTVVLYKSNLTSSNQTLKIIKLLISKPIAFRLIVLEISWPISIKYNKIYQIKMNFPQTISIKTIFIMTY